MVAGSAPKTLRRTRSDPSHISEQILGAFSDRAKRIGLRNLIMTELATELRMSASTLYRLYPSKEALAAACVERWADELGAAEAAKGEPIVGRDGFDQFMLWVEAWADANALLSPAFAHDLKTDYPAVWRRYREIVDERKRRGAALLRPLLKPELDRRVALALLDVIFKTVLEAGFADRLGISRREAIRSAMSVWAGGALARSGKLRSLRGSKPKARRSAPRTAAASDPRPRPRQ
jgi:AcrR family transcriptional regulator